VAAGQLRLTGRPIFPKSTKNKYKSTFGSPAAQEICSITTPLDDGVSSLFQSVSTTTDDVMLRIIKYSHTRTTSKWKMNDFSYMMHAEIL
jgi:hypothetical protein